MNAPEEVYFISNAVGITSHGQGSGVAQRWQYLIGTLLPGWLRLHAPLNVVLGPVFDDNNDGILDPFTPTGYDIHSSYQEAYTCVVLNAAP